MEANEVAAEQTSPEISIDSEIAAIESNERAANEKSFHVIMSIDGSTYTRHIFDTRKEVENFLLSSNAHLANDVEVIYGRTCNIKLNISLSVR
jgi:hypothetical protein